MKPTIFAATVFCLALFTVTSCSKKNDSISIYKVATIITEEVGNTDTASFMYNSAGQCIEANVFTPGRRVAYNYSATQVSALRYDSFSTTPNSSIIYQLNSQGLAASDDKGNTYTYNADGQLLTTTNTNGYISTNVWSGGNMVRTTDIAGGDTSTYNWTYYTDKPETRSFGMEWQGKRSKNLLSGYTLVSTSPGSVASTHTFTYESGSDGRVNKMTDTDGNAWNIVYWYSY